MKLSKPTRAKSFHKFSLSQRIFLSKKDYFRFSPIFLIVNKSSLMPHGVNMIAVDTVLMYAHKIFDFLSIERLLKTSTSGNWRHASINDEATE